VRNNFICLNQKKISYSGYGAPAISSGYGAPSSGYGAPSSGYGAPSSGYGAPSYGAPVSGGVSYAATTAADGGGLNLLALLPALAIPALGLLGLAALTLPVTTTIAGGRKKRSTGLNGTEEQAHLLSSYLNLHGFQQNFDLQKEMIASYLECGGQGRSAEMSSCLQRLVCNYHDKSLRLEAEDRDVASIIIRTIMDNKFLSKDYKYNMLAAGRRGARQSGTCHVYHCNNKVFFTG